jgi:hypothetical protein
LTVYFFFYKVLRKSHKNVKPYKEVDMRRIIVAIVLALCIACSAQALLAAGSGAESTTGDDWNWRFRPSLYFGFAFGGETHLIFENVGGPGLLGARKIDHELPSYSGMYAAAELPFAISDRFRVTLAGRWSFPAGEGELRQFYNDYSILSRRWDIGKRNWLAGDVLLSFALVKNAGLDFSLVAGFRYDDYTLELENAHNPSGVTSLPSDTISFSMRTYAPEAGLKIAFWGARSGFFSGEIRLGGLVGPYAWSSIDYEEHFAGAAAIYFEGAGKKAWFFNVFADLPLFMARLGSNSGVGLALFAQYSGLYGNDEVEGSSSPATLALDFTAETQVNTGSVGLKFTLVF